MVNEKQYIATVKNRIIKNISGLDWIKFFNVISLINLKITLTNKNRATSTNDPVALYTISGTNAPTKLFAIFANIL